MWNSEAPLKLLESMPAELDIHNLKNIQQTIDVDKYINSYQRKRDLCGEYAPFCKNCDKWVKYPCAVAYVKMKQAEGMQVEIAASAYLPADAEVEDEPEEPVEELSEVEEEPEEQIEEIQEMDEPEVVEESAFEHKKYIRIAIAKRKY